MPAQAGKPNDSSRKPAVTLRAMPRVAVAPARVVFTVDLGGGEDTEALHCLTLEWSWGDGTRSRSEGDCSEFVAGETKVQRVFQADHEYRDEGRPSAEVKVMKGERVVGLGSVRLTIGARRKDPSFEYRGR